MIYKTGYRVFLYFKYMCEKCVSVYMCMKCALLV